MLYIPICVKHEEVLFEDKVLWDKTSNNLDSIRLFALNWLQEKFFFYIKNELINSNIYKFKYSKLSNSLGINKDDIIQNSSSLIFSKPVNYEILNSK